MSAVGSCDRMSSSGSTLKEVYQGIPHDNLAVHLEFDVELPLQPLTPSINQSEYVPRRLFAKGIILRRPSVH